MGYRQETGTLTSWTGHAMYF